VDRLVDGREPSAANLLNKLKAFGSCSVAISDTVRAELTGDGFWKTDGRHYMNSASWSKYGRRRDKAG
jgi:hypothetical protein